MTRELLLLVQVVASCAMAGVIWVVQLVHYPLMVYVARDRFAAFERDHCVQIAFVVLPPMLVEAAVATWFVLEPAPTPSAAVLAWTGFALLAGLWVSTFLLQVPCHRALESGFDPTAHARLLRTNWIRSLGWSGRAAVAIAMCG